MSPEDVLVGSERLLSLCLARREFDCSEGQLRHRLYLPATALTETCIRTGQSANRKFCVLAIETALVVRGLDLGVGEGLNASVAVG
jgi:hypothetical protein